MTPCAGRRRGVTRREVVPRRVRTYRVATGTTIAVHPSSAGPVTGSGGTTGWAPDSVRQQDPAGVVGPPGWSGSRVVRRHPGGLDRSAMTTRYRVTVAGRLPEWTAGSIRVRFGAIGVHPAPGTTAISGTISDQSALRALLGLIWDNGATIIALSVEGIALSVEGSPRTSAPTVPVVDREPES